MNFLLVSTKIQGVTHPPDWSGNEIKEHKAVSLPLLGKLWGPLFHLFMGKDICLQNCYFLCLQAGWARRKQGMEWIRSRVPTYACITAAKAKLREKGSAAGRS